jgi:uncharacterized protein (TIGR00369 family)
MVACACTARELDQLLTDVPFTRQLGLKVRDVSAGQCTLEVPFQEVFERPGAVVSGQVFMAAADVAMWLAIKTSVGLSDTSVTSQMTTSFLAPARKAGFLCTARILKLGRRLIYGVVECVDDAGVPLTHHTITYMRNPLHPSR